MPGFDDINKEQWASVLPNIRDKIQSKSHYDTHPILKVN